MTFIFVMVFQLSIITLNSICFASFLNGSRKFVPDLSHSLSLSLFRVSRLTPSSCLYKSASTGRVPRRNLGIIL